MLAAFLMTNCMPDFEQLHSIAELTDGGLVLVNGEVISCAKEIEENLPFNWICLPSEWVDFSTTLNHGFQTLKHMGYEWVFRVDSDIDCSETKDLKTIINDHEDKAVILGWAQDHWQHRLVRSNVEWVGATHEWTNVSAEFIVQDDRIQIKETPKTKEQLIAKFQRDYALLLNEKPSARTRFYCAYSVWALWRWGALDVDIAIPLANHYLYEAMALAPRFEESCWIIYHLVEFSKNESEVLGTEASRKFFEATLRRWITDFPLCIELHILAEQELQETFPMRKEAEAMNRNLVWLTE